MEHVIAQTLIQGCVFPPEASVAMCSFWDWAFWAGVAVGVVAGVICFLRKPQA